MLFSSLLFLFCFLSITLLLYFTCPRGKKNIWKNTVLFVVSVIFYAWGEPIYIFLMLFTILHNYIAALLIDRHKKSAPKAAKMIIIASIVLNLGVLAFFKYSNFFIGNINNIFGFKIELINLALPIGISFYTFQAMSYTIDVYRGVTAVQHNFISFGAYVTFFPQLIAGPIVQYKTIAEQLDNRTNETSMFGSGVKTFTVGLAKKVLLANNIGMLWSEVSSLPQSEMTVLTAWLGIIAFAFQIYFDFSGYSDMAIGLGRMFGFEFCVNFDYPYISQSATEFWRRWHISLGTWFREYLYIPLGGNRVSQPKFFRNILIVWFCTGFWHGAGWNYIFWGLYFGILLIAEKKFLLKWFKKIPSVFRHVYLITVVLISWVLFAIEDISDCFGYLASMFGFGGVPIADERSIYLLSTNTVLIVISIVASIPILPYIQKKLSEKQSVVCETVTIIASICIWFLVTASLVSGSYNPFLYFRF